MDKTIVSLCFLALLLLSGCGSGTTPGAGTTPGGGASIVGTWRSCVTAASGVDDEIVMIITSTASAVTYKSFTSSDASCSGSLALFNRTVTYDIASSNISVVANSWQDTDGIAVTAPNAQDATTGSLASTSFAVYSQTVTATSDVVVNPIGAVSNIGLVVDATGAVDVLYTADDNTVPGTYLGYAMPLFRQ